MPSRLLSLLRSEIVFQSSLIFHDLILFHDFDILWNGPQFTFVWCFLLVRLELRIFDKMEVKCTSCGISKSTWYQHLLVVMLILMTWLRLCLSGVSAMKLLFSLFYILFKAAKLWGEGNRDPPSGERSTTEFVVCSAKLLQSFLSLCDPMDHIQPGSSIHGILQARILEWVAMPFSRRSSWPRDRTCISYISYIGRQVLYHKHHLGSPTEFVDIC